MKNAQRKGIMWAVGAAIVSGISIYVNKFGVAQIKDPFVYTTVKNSAVVIGLLAAVGLLASWKELRCDPCEAMDNCRISWGQVVALEGSALLVEAMPLEIAGHCLVLGTPERRTVKRAFDGKGFVSAARVGEWVSMHWGWACQVLAPRQKVSSHRMVGSGSHSRSAGSGPGYFPRRVSPDLPSSATTLGCNRR